MVRKGGLEPPRYCYRQPLKPEEIENERSRSRRIGVGCHASVPFGDVRGRLSRHGLQILANYAVFSREARAAAHW
jgi:hypothetical protein